MQKTLALFDFDGTITSGDSLIVFLLQMVGLKRGFAKLPVVLKHWARLLLAWNLSHDTAKEVLLKVHMPMKTRMEWDRVVRDFFAACKPDYYNEAVLNQLRALRDAGATVAVVSASIDIWLQPFVDAEGIDLICTGSKWEDDRWVGFATPNCRKDEKVRRIKAAYSLESYERIVAFGNTSSDYHMLRMAGEAWLVRRGGILKPWKP